MTDPEQIPLLEVERQLPTAESDEWYTPTPVFEQLDKEFKFTVDAAATHESRKVERFFSKEQDGLVQSYAGEMVFCNPPYSDIAPWVRKAIHAIAYDKARGWVMLLPAWTDREWWARWVEPFRWPIGQAPSHVRDLPNGNLVELVHVELRFRKGRIRFGYPGNPEGRGQNGGGFDPSVFLVYRPR